MGLSGAKFKKPTIFLPRLAQQAHPGQAGDMGSYPICHQLGKPVSSVSLSFGDLMQSGKLGVIGVIEI